MWIALAGEEVKPLDGFQQCGYLAKAAHRRCKKAQQSNPYAVSSGRRRCKDVTPLEMNAHNRSISSAIDIFQSILPNSLCV